jgi:glycosyltransferase involved in cell wall biosynthesis
MNPNKNLAGVVKAFEALRDLDFDLVIAGEPNSRVFGEVNADGTARWTGRVSDEELKALYEAASCFVHASFYEGFGLPPLEALACGCPVVSSDAASLPEVLGDAALYCDPSNPQDIANKIRLALSGEYRPAGVQTALDRFQWKHSAARLKEILDALRERCNEAQGREAHNATPRSSPLQKGSI